MHDEDHPPLFSYADGARRGEGKDARMSLLECEATLARYQQQNATCRNKLYADLAAPPPTHHHPLALVAAGVVLGALAVVAYRMMRTG